jgi:transposase
MGEATVVRLGLPGSSVVDDPPLLVLRDGGRRMLQQVVEAEVETFVAGERISAVARRQGVAPNLLYLWRPLMTDGGAIAVQADDGVTGNAEVRRLEARVRELERQLGRKTLEVEVLKEGLDRSRVKKPTLLTAWTPPGGSR